MEVGSQQFRDKVAAMQVSTQADPALTEEGHAYISSSGEMKMSLRQIIWKW